jgi:hypothetical protein
LRCAEALDKHPTAVNGAALPDGGSPCASISSSTTSPAFSITRKRRKSFPSETQVRCGDRVVHGDVELTEKLGRNDLCPCGSGRRFQTLLHGIGTLRWRQPRLLFSGSDGPVSSAADPTHPLLSHSKIESTVRYLGVEVDDALAIAEQTNV